jgi:hypothetical protein
MGYIGKQPALGNYIKIDDISSGFNGSTRTFDLQSNGSDIIVGSPNQLIICLNGLVKNPNVDFTISNTAKQITFTTAPTNGTGFIGLMFGEVMSFPTVSDNTVSTVKLQDGAVTTSKIATGSITTPKLADSSVTTDKILSSAITNVKLADDVITTVKLQNNSVTGAKIASSTINFSNLNSSIIPSQAIAEAGTSQSYLSTPLSVAQYVSNQVSTIRSIPQNSKSADYTLVIGDAGKHIFHPTSDGTARTFTIPSNSSVAYPIGTAITFVNQNLAGVITIAITTDTMRLAGSGLTGSRTLAANGIATALKVNTTEWLISGTGLS